MGHGASDDAGSHDGDLHEVIVPVRLKPDYRDGPCLRGWPQRFQNRNCIPTSTRRAAAADVGCPKNGDWRLPVKLRKFVWLSTFDPWT